MTEEKGVLGFCLSGHLFNAYAGEVRQFAKSRISELDVSREPKWIAGIIAGIRTQMSQRGKMMVVSLDDGSATIEVTVFSELLEQKRAIFREDEFLAVFGKVSEDRFSGGLRLNADDALDITEARLHFGQHMAFDLPEKFSAFALKEILSAYVNGKGMRLRTNYVSGDNRCLIDFGADWQILPKDECLNRLAQHFENVRVVY